jgi:hypothetical protein
MSSYRVGFVAALVTVIGFTAACGSDDGASDEGAGSDAGPAEVDANVGIDSGGAPTADSGDTATPGGSAETTVPASVHVGEEIEVKCSVRDSNGTVHDAPAGAVPTITFTPSDAVTVDSNGKTKADKEGTVAVRCAFPSLSLTDESPASLAILAPALPTITCGSPTNDSMLDAAPGSSITFSGSVADVNGITALTVNGAPVTLTGNDFSTSVTTRFGINFVDVTATNGRGKTQSKRCTFLAAGTWRDPTALAADELSLALTQTAVDDGDRTGAVKSLADLVSKVAASPATVSAVDQPLQAANPLKASSCDVQICPSSCICVAQSSVSYVPGGIKSEVPTTLDLTLGPDGAITGHVHFTGLNVELDLVSSSGGTNDDSTGWVRYDSADVFWTSKPEFENGQFVVTSSASAATLGDMSTYGFSANAAPFINSVVVPLGQGKLKTLLSSALQDSVTTHVAGEGLASLLEGVESSVLGSFNVPKLDASGSIPVAFGFAVSSADVDNDRILFGAGTLYSTTAANVFPSLGIAIPPGAVLNDEPVPSPATVAQSTHVGVFNQATHALWRANMFDTTLDGTTIGGGAPPAATVKLKAKLPPVLSMAPYDSTTPNGVELSLGSVAVEVVYPGLFDVSHPFVGEVGGRVTATAILLNNDDIDFNVDTLTELVVDSDVELAPSTRTTLEGFLAKVLFKVAYATLNDSLPALPALALRVPGSFADYGINIPAKLGPTSPVFSVPMVSFEPRYVVRRGTLDLH